MEPIPLTSPPAKRLLNKRFLRWAPYALVFLAVACIAFWQGMQLRQQIFLRRTSIPEQMDIELAFQRGAAVMRLARQSSNGAVPTWRQFWSGYVSLYPSLEANGNRQNLDYPPLRLLVVSLWVRHVQSLQAGAVSQSLPQSDPNCISPLLNLNSTCGAMAAVGMFFLVWVCMARQERCAGPPVPPHAGTCAAGYPWRRLWWACAPLAGAAFWVLAAHALRREQWPGGFGLAAMGLLFIVLVASTRSWPVPFRYWGCGLIAAILLWLNAALLIDGYLWIQWDVWLLPAFVWAALLATLDWWLPAGILIAVGGMLKGQMFLVAPLFVLWPVFAGRISAALRWLAGFAIASAVVLGPWLLATPAARIWAAWLAMGALVLAAVFFVPKLWPARSLSRQFRRAGVWLCLSLGGCVFLAAYWGRGDWSWYNIGFKFGTELFQVMAMGHVANVPGLLDWLGWFDDLHAPVGPLHIPGTSWQFTCEIRTFLAALYAVGLILCAAGCALHHRRRDTRLLLALLAPWVLFPLLLTQMSGRYWLWCAAISSGLVGVSVGASLLTWALTAAATIFILNRMSYHQGWHGPTPHRIDVFASQFYPDLVWPLMLIALICLWLALYPRRLERGKSP